MAGEAAPSAHPKNGHTLKDTAPRKAGGSQERGRRPSAWDSLRCPRSTITITQQRSKGHSTPSSSPGEGAGLRVSPTHRVPKPPVQPPTRRRQRRHCHSGDGDRDAHRDLPASALLLQCCVKLQSPQGKKHLIRNK